MLPTRNHPSATEPSIRAPLPNATVSLAHTLAAATPPSVYSVPSLFVKCIQSDPFGTVTTADSVGLPTNDSRFAGVGHVGVGRQLPHTEAAVVAVVAVVGHVGGGRQHTEAAVVAATVVGNVGRFVVVVVIDDGLVAVAVAVVVGPVGAFLLIHEF